MNKSITLCFLILTLISCATKDKHDRVFFKKGEVRICGHLSNNDLQNDQTIAILIPDFLTGKDIVIIADADSLGFFNSAFTIKMDQEIRLRYQNRQISLLVTANDSLFINVDTENDEIVITGTNRERNILLQEYSNEFHIISKEYKDQLSGFENNYDSLKNISGKADKKLDSLNNSFFSSSKPDDLLMNWINAHKKALCDYYFIICAENQNMPVTFLNDSGIINNSDINKQEYYCNTDYVANYFNLYLGNTYYEKRPLTNRVIQFLQDENYNFALDILSDSLLTTYSSIAKDAVLFQFFDEMTNPQSGMNLNIDSLGKYVIASISNDFVKRELETTISKIQVYNAENESTDTSIDFLEQLIQKHKGKVLYIDIWATWCSPCMGEMPYSVDLQKKMKDNNVVFTYLCTLSKKSDWETVSKNLNLNGENIFLSDEQYYRLLSDYKINTGVPQYLLIDRQGKVFTTSAKRPSDNRTIDDINALLN